MKNLKFFAALCCVAAAFAACEPQNGPDNGQNGDNGTAANTENGYEWVDLGLSVKWATHNVGAVRPEGYGDYFAWGETEPKSSYSNSNYSYSANPSVLPLDRDAARANWGGAWRMPTNAEWTELREKCAWKWTDDYKGIGVHGYIVTSLTNGNAIFLPAAGLRDYGDLGFAGYDGYYWSSSLYTDYPGHAWFVYFFSDGVDGFYNDRYCGLSVRPVL
ncbi:MAG: hypothetical protein ACI30H_04915 [Paludibacteraceae bacterium]